MFEDRRDKLHDIVENRGLESEHKMRLEGAIDEIDFLLTTLRHEMRVADDQLTTSTDVTPLTLQELVAEAHDLEAEKDIDAAQAPMQELRKIRDGK
jgi:hypothetical protein